MKAHTSFYKDCLKCKAKVKLFQPESWMNPVGICECGQGYFAIYGNGYGSYGIYLNFINAELISTRFLENAEKELAHAQAKGEK